MWDLKVLFGLASCPFHVGCCNCTRWLIRVLLDRFILKAFLIQLQPFIFQKNPPSARRHQGKKELLVTNHHLDPIYQTLRRYVRGTYKWRIYGKILFIVPRSLLLLILVFLMILHFHFMAHIMVTRIVTSTHFQRKKQYQALLLLFSSS